MRVTYRIPTDMYAYVEVEHEHDDTPDVATIKQTYDDLSSAFKAQVGMEKKDFDGFIERYISGDDVHVEEYTQMSKDQQEVVQVIKRAKKRLLAKVNHHE